MGTFFLFSFISFFLFCFPAKHIDPHYVKSPLPGSGAAPNSNSRPSSRSGSLKGLKGHGFLSLLLCCTFGAGSFLDNSDKSAVFSRHRKKNNTSTNNRHSRASTTTASTSGEKPSSTPAKSPTLPKICTSPTELAHFDNSRSSTDQQQDSPDTQFTSATPRSIPPQSPEVTVVYIFKKKTNRQLLCMCQTIA